MLCIWPTDWSQCPQVKTSAKRVYRLKSPSQHAAIRCAAGVDFDLSYTDDDVQCKFDLFYNIAHHLLSGFYPERSVTTLCLNKKSELGLMLMRRATASV